MNRPDKETLRRVIHKMHKQNDCEKFTELASVFTGMRGKLNPHSVEFSSDDPYHSFPLSIKCIHCVIREEEYLYILCYSGNLHILGIHERGHSHRRATELAGTFLLDLLLMVEPSPHKENRQTTKRRFH